MTVPPFGVFAPPYGVGRGVLVRRSWPPYRSPVPPPPPPPPAEPPPPPPPPPAPSITIDPSSPGTLTETVAGQGAKKKHTITTTAMDAFTWVVAKADFAWREPRQTVQTGGSATIEPTFHETGDFLKVLKADDFSVYRDSAPAVVTKALPPPIDVLIRGADNASLAVAFGAHDAFAATLAALCGVPVNVIARREQATGDNTLHGSTSTAWVDPFDNSFGRWLTVPGAGYDGWEARSAIDYSTDPAGWPAHGPLTETLAAIERHRSAAPNRLFVDARLFLEYDLVSYGGQPQDRYRAMAWEVTRRIQAAAGAGPGRHFIAYLHSPFTGKTLRAVDALAAAWAADEAERGVILAGNMMDASPFAAGNSSHWAADGPLRSFPRLAVALAKRLRDAGVLPAGSGVDLSDAPGPGPRIASVERTSPTTLAAQVAHDRGTALVAQSGTVDWSAFEWRNTEAAADATDGTLDGSTINLTFPGPIPSTGAEKLHYCRWPAFRGQGLITDDWHLIRPAKFNAVPNIGAVVFPLRREAVGVAF